MQEEIKKKLLKSINYRKFRDHCHYTGKYSGAAHNSYNLKFNVPVVFHNGSSYDYHLIIKELADEFEVQIECLRENKERNKTFLRSSKKANYKN